MKEIQKGLMLKEETKFIRGKYINVRQLISSEGYCFYSKLDKQEIDNWQSEEEPPTLKYMTSAFLGVYDNIDNYVSVPIEEDFEIV